MMFSLPKPYPATTRSSMPVSEWFVAGPKTINSSGMLCSKLFPPLLSYVSMHFISLGFTWCEVLTFFPLLSSFVNLWIEFSCSDAQCIWVLGNYITNGYCFGWWQIITENSIGQHYWVVVVVLILKYLLIRIIGITHSHLSP